MRKDINRGGVFAYIKTDLAFNFWTDLRHEQLEILPPHTKPFLVSVWYRPPNVKNIFDLMKKFYNDKEHFVDMETIFL